MTTKVAASIAVIAAGLVACSTTPPVPPGGSVTTLTCASAQCDVPINQDGLWPFSDLQVAEEIIVNTPRPMTLTWRITSAHSTRFNPDGGITFADPGFACGVDPNDSQVYSCKNNAGNGRFKYTIKTKGFGSPPDRDPFIRNGS